MPFDQLLRKRHNGFASKSNKQKTKRARGDSDGLSVVERLDAASRAAREKQERRNADKNAYVVLCVFASAHCVP